MKHHRDCHLTGPVELSSCTCGLVATEEEMRELLKEAGDLFRFYETSHRARGPDHHAKAERNAEIADRIEELLARGK